MPIMWDTMQLLLTITDFAKKYLQTDAIFLDLRTNSYINIYKEQWQIDFSFNNNYWSFDVGIAYEEMIDDANFDY